MCEEQLAQSRLLMAQLGKDVYYSQARREEDLRRQLERHDDDLVRARAATEDAKAQASMQTRVAEELKTALANAERAFFSERTSLEESLRRERGLRQAEAEAHASRVVGWDRKLADFQAAATSSVMDIRVYINNDPIFQALKVGLEREEKLLNAIGLQTQRAATQRATDEIVQLNQRVSDLQRVSAECVAAQTKAAADIATLCDEAQKAKLHALRTQLSELQ